uniref:40S ribosomal protein S19-binding protein 1 n=1 Tax=Strongyloides venezuelensis TaxID=75913 RepID=A0A0K0FUV0_STRVS
MMGCNVSNVVEKGREKQKKVKILRSDKGLSIDDNEVLKKKTFPRNRTTQIGATLDNIKKINAFDKKRMLKEVLKTAKIKEIDDDSLISFPEDETFYDIPETMSDLDYGYELVKI